MHMYHHAVALTALLGGMCPVGAFQKTSPHCYFKIWNRAYTLHDRVASRPARSHADENGQLPGYDYKSSKSDDLSDMVSPVAVLFSSDRAVSRRNIILSTTATLVMGMSRPAVAEVDTAPQPEVQKNEETAGFTRGPDEFGVLFGDGPIGLKLGDNPLKAKGICRVYVTQVLLGAQAIRQPSVHTGLGIAAVGGIATVDLGSVDVAEIIRASPRPLEIIFRDPELLSLRTQAEVAEQNRKKKALRQKQVQDDATLLESATPSSSSATGPSKSNGGGAQGMKVTRVSKPSMCGTKSRAGDLLEIRYTGRLASDLSVEFDSSDSRGTGLPYAFTLGNGEVVKGLDLSLFDMCIGERRRVEVPARLAYGAKGSRSFKIPPDDGTAGPSGTLKMGRGDLVFGVELVSINFRSSPSDMRDNFYTDAPCDKEAFGAGNASGQCRGVETMFMEQDPGDGGVGRDTKAAVESSK